MCLYGFGRTTKANTAAGENSLQNPNPAVTGIHIINGPHLKPLFDFPVKQRSRERTSRMHTHFCIIMLNNVFYK